MKLPVLFPRCHTDICYLFTPFGPAHEFYFRQELDARGRFTIAAAQPPLEVSWQLTGVVGDPAGLKQPLRVDAAKPARYRGRYVQPALYGQPRSKSLVAPRPQPRTPRPVRHPKAAAPPR